jgi:FtsH-binding integral membrane protein
MSTDNPFVIEQAAPSERADFYRRAYLTVAGAFAVFGVLLWAAFAVPVGEAPLALAYMRAIGGMVGALGNWSLLLVLGLFWLGTSVAQSAVYASSSRSVKLAGFLGYILLQVAIFIPLIALVLIKTSGNPSEILLPACGVTGALVLGLTVAAFVTRADFSFLRTVLVVGSFAALGVVAVAILAGSSLGIWFSMAMIALMATAVLYQTWQVRTQFGTGQHLEAGFALFAAFVTLLFYVIRLFLQRRN